MAILSAVPPDKSVAKTCTGAFGFGKEAVTLSMKIADLLVFLYPNSGPGNTYSDSEAGEHRPRATFIVEVTVSIAEGSLPPPPIRSLTVQLEGLESMKICKGLEQNVISYATKRVEDASSLEMVPGSAYRWEVPIEVQHDVAPYERSKYGQMIQTMRVHLEWETKGKSLSSQYKCLQVERDVWLTCIPRLSNMLDYAKTHRTSTEELGPMVVHVRTHHLTVGSYLRLGVCLSPPAPGVEIVKMELMIKQITTLHSRKRPGHFQQCDPEMIPVLTVDGREFQAKMLCNDPTWIARLPFDNILRPSTLSGSKDAAIQVSHKIMFCLTFIPKGYHKDGQALYTAQWPILLSSCTCRWRSLMLPTYEELDSCPVPDDVPEAKRVDPNGVGYRGRRTSHTDVTDCCCGISMDDILKFEDEFEVAQHSCLREMMAAELIEASAISPNGLDQQRNASAGGNTTNGGVDEVHEYIRSQKASQEYVSDGR